MARYSQCPDDAILPTYDGDDVDYGADGVLEGLDLDDDYPLSADRTCDCPFCREEY